MFQEQQGGQCGQSEMDTDRNIRDQRDNKVQKGYRKQIQSTTDHSKDFDFECECHQKLMESLKQNNDMI